MKFALNDNASSLECKSVRSGKLTMERKDS